jgi:hypothetical protein
MGVCEGAFPPPILQKQRCPSALQTIDCTLADYQLQKSMGQTTNRNIARLPSLFGMKITQVPSQYSNQIGEVQARNEVWVRAKAPSCRQSCKSSAALQLSSNNQPYSCRLSIAEKHGQTTNRNRARLLSLFGMKFTQVPSQYSNHIIICMHILV